MPPEPVPSPAACCTGGSVLDHREPDDPRDEEPADSAGTVPSYPLSPADSSPAPVPEATTAAAASPLAPGQILGQRYRVTGLLGQGGMGEVWRAYDLKLQVDVALKAVRAERFAGRRGLDLLRREVRAAREVMSPNVCRIFDLVEVDGREFVSMEYVDGQTLLAVLRERGPLELAEATRLASQFLAGLEAIHQAGLVHRDVKPENIMVTRTGRVVVMDFGIAKGIAADASGTVAGTPAYMAPEQGRGESLDARADIFAAGVVLAEMLAPTGVRERASRESVWRAVRDQPVRLYEGPWRAVLERAVAPERARRFGSARELARALEDVAQRVDGAEERRPYPGLASFTAADAEYFFGREVEVEAVWTKLQRASLLAVVGPSGAGKSSFLQAGLLPARPAGWRHVVCRPGSTPFAALAQALATELAGDAEAVRELVQIEQPAQALAAVGRWRRQHEQALIVVDQFEELFTLCRPPVQAAFADLLGRLAEEADVHVLLLLRDDFLLRCHEHPRLSPLFAELTPLVAPAGSALRRALVQPALLCGYRFEDEALADEMLGALEGERGALPLLAFAAARLWEQRDRERGLLTREAYTGIGGVSGALAQHAEATLERIGGDRQPLVREIFRNLVTAQGTRAVVAVEDLLSVFAERATAEQVLRELIDARLLTSFEVTEGGQGGREQRRVEIVHESLLASWPRLVRWQTQDADGAQLRDQLRQAAQLWRDRGELTDLLWTGSAYREFELWRERYSGGLTEIETAFARAMQAGARRRRRRRRLALTGSFALLVVVLGIVGGLWRRSARMTAVSEARRLHMVAEDAIETDNTLALALATAILEREDDPAVRRTALKALWKAPTRFTIALSEGLAGDGGLSPDGQWYATAQGNGVLLWPRDGRDPQRLSAGPGFEDYVTSRLDFSPDARFLLGSAFLPADPARPWLHVLWSLPDGRVVRSWAGHGFDGMFSFVRRDPPQVFVAERDDMQRPWSWWRYSLDRDMPEQLGRADTHTEDIHEFTVDPTGRYLLDSKGAGVFLFPLDSLQSAPPVLVGRHEQDIWGLAFDASGALIVSADKMGGIRVWAKEEGGGWRRLMSHQTDETVIRFVGFNRAASRVVYRERQIRQVAMLDRARPEAESMLLWPLPGGGAETRQVPLTGFTPEDAWVAFTQVEVGGIDAIVFYPLASRFPQVFRVFPAESRLQPLCFTGGGRRLVATRIPELRGFEVLGGESRGEILWQHPTGRTIATIASNADFGPLLGGSYTDGEAWLIPLDDTQAQALRCEEGGTIGGVALSADGLRAAVGGSWAWSYSSDPATIRIWDLATGAVQVLKSGGKTGFYGLRFLPRNRLVSSSAEGLLLWDLATGAREVLSDQPHGWLSGPDAQGRCLLADSPRGLTLWDLERRTERLLPVPTDTWMGSDWTASHRRALSPDGRFVAVGMHDGELWVLPLDTDEPHVLLGHEGGVGAVWIPPESDRIYSAAADGTVRIWSVPGGVPLHTLPLPELLAVLRAQTNLRVVPDAKAADGYRVVFDRFPGWQTAPAWQNMAAPAPRRSTGS